jgi:hypothetical protein
MRSDYIYYKTKNDAEIQNIPDALSEYGAFIVYGTSTHLRNLRVFDPTRVYKVIMFNDSNQYSAQHGGGDYTYFDDAGSYDGQTLLLATDSDYQRYPGYIQNKYVYQKKVGMFNVYTSDGKCFDLTNTLPSSGYAMNFPHTPGVHLRDGEIGQDGAFYALAMANTHVLWGPYAPCESGLFDFTLNYEVISPPLDSSVVGIFDITIQDGTRALQEIEIVSDRTNVTIKDVSFEGWTGTFEHRVFLNQGANVKIVSIEIIKKA